MLKEGGAHPAAMDILTNRWLTEYVTACGPVRSGDLEDDLAGGASPAEWIITGDPLGKFHSSIFFPALQRLVKSGVIVFGRDRRDQIWYALAGQLPVDVTPEQDA